MNDAPRENRRGFLSGRSAVEAARAVVRDLTAGPGLPPPVSSPPPERSGNEPVGPESAPASPVAPPESTFLVEIERKAMACRFAVSLNAGFPPHGTPAAVDALDAVDETEALLTIYREFGEVVHLNRHAHLRPVETSEELFSLLQRGAELTRLTDGAFDLTSGPLIRVWGFFERRGAVPDPEALAAARARVGMRHVLLDPADRTVRFAVPDMELNFGAFGKGYALDQAAARLLAAGVPNFLLQGGASSLVARGRRIVAETGACGMVPVPGWRVGLVHPLLRNRTLAEVTLCDRAMGTSGCGVQFFLHEGKRLGHILDPRSGLPAEGCLSSTVWAADGASADALSTACYVGGAETARRVCAARPDVGVLLVARRGRDAALVCETVGAVPADLTFTVAVRRAGE